MVMSVTTWIWISELKERNILQHSINHINFVVDTVKHMHNMIMAALMKDLKRSMEYFKKADESEDKADNVKRSIIEILSSGTIHPVDREYLLRLVLTADDVAAYAKAVVRRLKIILDLGYEIPAELGEMIKQMSHKILDSAALLLEAIKILTKDPKGSLKIASDVEKLEEDVDNIRINALEILFRYCRMEFGPHCMVFKELIDHLENTSDKCEDTADIIRAIAIALA